MEAIYLVYYHAYDMDASNKVFIFATHDLDKVEKYVHKFNRILKSAKEHYGLRYYGDDFWSDSDYDRYNLVDYISLCHYAQLEVR